MEHDEPTMPDHAWDLPVYRQMLDACFQTLSTLIPSLPSDAESHLVAGLARSCQRIPDLISLGVATWQSPQRFPYLDLAVRECHDMIQRMRYCEHTHGDSLDRPVAARLIQGYEQAVKELRALTAQTPPRSRPLETPVPARPAERMAGRMTLGMQS